MIANMTKTEYIPIGIENIITLIPLMIHFLCNNKLERITLEPLANYICLVFLIIIFYSHIAMISMQYLARNPEKRFLTIHQISKEN